MIEAREQFAFKSQDIYQKICGIQDFRLKDVEKEFNIKIIPRGIELIFHGKEDLVGSAKMFFYELQNEFLKRPDREYLDQEDLNQFIQKLYKKYLNKPFEEITKTPEENWTPREKVFVNYKGKPIYPRTENQEEFVLSLKNNYISFALGPAGTGKTFLSIAVACRMMQNGEVDRLVLTRPAVEAGENLGFLPGDLAQKVNPYLRPIYDALHECIGFEKTNEYLSSGKIEIAPIAYMRGRTLTNSFIILDEAQNCTISQLKMFLTRFGKNSKMSISGDITQIDLDKEKSGLEKTITILKNTKGIGFVQFTEEDITRHPIVSIVVKKFEGAGL